MKQQEEEARKKEEAEQLQDAQMADADGVGAATEAQIATDKAEAVQTANGGATAVQSGDNTADARNESSDPLEAKVSGPPSFRPC